MNDIYDKQAAQYCSSHLVILTVNEWILNWDKGMRINSGNVIKQKILVNNNFD